MKWLLHITVFILISGLTISCKKDDPENEPVKTEDEYLIKQEIQTESISASGGGSIELPSGVIVNIPANALPADNSISVETIDPYRDGSEFVVPKELKGTKLSAVVRCTPEGTTFDSPVEVIIPYYTELWPENLPNDSMLVVSYSGDSIEIIPFFIDKTNMAVIAETNHFSDFVIIAKKDILVDRGRMYKTVVIGDQVWMAENLAFLPEVHPVTDNSLIESRYYVYEYSGTSIEGAKSTSKYFTYGVLYNWPAAMESSPEGWHLPSDDDWKQLELYMGMSQEHVDSYSGDFPSRGTDEGTRLKATKGWVNARGEAENGTDEYGFTALPAGYAKVNQSKFDNVGESTRFWTSTAIEEWSAHYIRSIGGAGISRFGGTDNENQGYSVRCVKD